MTRRDRVTKFIRDFDSLPDDFFVPVEVSITAHGDSRAAYYTRAAKGQRPAVHKTGERSAACRVGEIRASLKAIGGAK